MKKKFIVLFVLLVTVFFIPISLFAQSADVFRQEGIASWYGKEYDGRPTASGEIFDSSGLTAAHPNLPFGTILVVTNQHNNKKVTVRINDRGPFVAARIIDISRAAAEQLDMIVTGTAPVKIESIDRIAAATHVVPAPVIETLPVIDTLPVIITTQTSTVNVSQPVVIQIPNQIKLTPVINIIPNKTYRLQIGSYKIARNAVDVFDKLKDFGLNPAYEKFTGSDNGEYFRVVLAGVHGYDVETTTQKLNDAGFKEALIREEN